MCCLILQVANWYITVQTTAIRCHKTYIIGSTALSSSKILNKLIGSLLSTSTGRRGRKKPSPFLSRDRHLVLIGNGFLPEIMRSLVPTCMHEDIGIYFSLGKQSIEHSKS